MGERNLFQPLTREDKITVVLYRTGIAMSALAVSSAAYMLSAGPPPASSGMLFSLMLVSLHISVGMSVFFIHLYVSKFHRALKGLYYLSLVALLLLYITGGGDFMQAFTKSRLGPVLLIPLSGCLGFITAKEAFCFRLNEGYLVALVMPVYLLLVSAGVFSTKGVAYGAALIAAMLILFTLRKVFMPLHYDIGDKSAYV